MSRLIGLLGFIGSGKGTVGDLLRDFHGFTQDSFAAPLKDAAAAIFGWDRQLLEGITPESRAWREEIDEFWSQEFSKPFTPRMALQLLGTEAGRNVFHPNIWTGSLFKRAKNRDVVVTDCRFMNEVEGIHKEGGLVVFVQRGPLPSWWHIAKEYNQLHTQESLDALVARGIHESERAWIGCPIDYVVYNDGTLNDLRTSVDDLVQQIAHP